MQTHKALCCSIKPATHHMKVITDACRWLHSKAVALLRNVTPWKAGSNWRGLRKLRPTLLRWQRGKAPGSRLIRVKSLPTMQGYWTLTACPPLRMQLGASLGGYLERVAQRAAPCTSADGGTDGLSAAAAAQSQGRRGALEGAAEGPDARLARLQAALARIDVLGAQGAMPIDEEAVRPDAQTTGRVRPAA